MASVSTSSSDINGKAIAATIRLELKERVSTLPSAPGLAVILVGARRDSQTYVRMKKKACEECGINSFGFDYPDTATEIEILEKSQELNADERVHGILVQLPLPKHMNENTIIEAVHPSKDVDGLPKKSIGRIWHRYPFTSPARPRDALSSSIAPMSSSRARMQLSSGGAIS
jgi:5,10-methylene-tetrahydrofolate dehydrogenase/methenyl tetrahydrofolate cyclohydrolase